MYSLSDKQIDYILNDIGARGVKTEDLQYNLLDHICCIIEKELEVNGDFERFYGQAISRFYKKELAEIEDETQLLLTFKHYYTMKKIMFISGIFSAFLMLAGAYFKIMHWPGANVMLIIGILCLSAFFLPMMFTLKLREKTEKRDKVVLILGLVISVYLLVGALFKLMHWPAAGVFVLTGLPVLLFIYLPIYIYNGVRNPAAKVNTIVTSILIVAGCGFLMVLPQRSNIYNPAAKHNYLKNQEISLGALAALVQEDSSNTELYASWRELMKNAERLKNALAKMAAEADYKVYMENHDWGGSELVNPTAMKEFTETRQYISSLLDFEKSANTTLYVFENYTDLQFNDRQAQVDFILSNQVNVKDLLATIINTQEQACLVLVKR
jgi:hypothetical protein